MIVVVNAIAELEKLGDELWSWNISDMDIAMFIAPFHFVGLPINC